MRLCHLIGYKGLPHRTPLHFVTARVSLYRPSVIDQLKRASPVKPSAEHTRESLTGSVLANAAEQRPAGSSRSAGLLMPRNYPEGHDRLAAHKTGQNLQGGLPFPTFPKPCDSCEFVVQSSRSNCLDAVPLWVRARKLRSFDLAVFIGLIPFPHQNFPRQSRTHCA